MRWSSIEIILMSSVSGMMPPRIGMGRGSRARAEHGPFHDLHLVIGVGRDVVAVEVERLGEMLARLFRRQRRAAGRPSSGLGQEAAGEVSPARVHDLAVDRAVRAE